jgi:hypothetical protein
MINPRIKLLLDPHFIRFAADSYQWALDADEECRALSTSKQKEVNVYRRGVSYEQTATDLINAEFKDVCSGAGLGSIDLDDAKRSWRIVNRRQSEDPLGLAYVWFITRISLYVPDRKGHTHHKLDAKLTRNEIVSSLFRQFLNWAEASNQLGMLSPTPENPAFIDEIEGLFVATIDVLTESNPYVQQIFKGTPMAEAMTPTVLASESIETETNPIIVGQTKAN